MKRFRFYIAMLAAKTLRLILKLLGKNATYLPGELALKISKDFIGQLKKPETLITVTGTNGKTTTSNLLTSVLRANGYRVTNNSYGSNVQAGVAAALLADSDFKGRPKNKIAVLEVDERSSLLVYPFMAPDYTICNNIMRDSLKRNAHTEFISFIINSAMPESTRLFLNADDIICAYLAPQCSSRCYFGVDAQKPQGGEGQAVRDIVYCPHCGGRLQSEYIRYNHIGRLFCPKCGFKNPERDFTVSSIDAENGVFTVEHDGKSESFRLINDNIVNVYNFCGAIALLTRLGLSFEQISKGFLESAIVKTRFDSEKIGDISLTMQLAKGQNPVACTRCYSYAAKTAGENKSVIIMVDDKGDNTNNSESTCWLYDCDYSYLADDSIGQIIFAGKRCRDHYLRALTAGVDREKIVLTDSPENATAQLDLKLHKSVLVLYDPYLLSEAQKVKNDITVMAERF